MDGQMLIGRPRLHSCSAVKTDIEASLPGEYPDPVSAAAAAAAINSVPAVGCLVMESRRGKVSIPSPAAMYCREKLSAATATNAI